MLVVKAFNPANLKNKSVRFFIPFCGKLTWQIIHVVKNLLHIVIFSEHKSRIHRKHCAHSTICIDTPVT